MARKTMSLPAPDPAPRESRSARKRVAENAQKVGQSLLEVPPETLERFDLPELLMEALADARRHKGHQASRRSLQRVGALMRELDVAAVERQLADWRAGGTRENARLEQVRRWRDALVNGERGALEDVLRSVPSLPRDEMEALVAGAQRERAGDHPPRNFRALYTRIRDAWQG